MIRQYAVETDIHPFAKGIKFEELWKNKRTGKIGGVSIYFASLSDLIKMKKAAGRKKDKDDLKILNQLKRKSAKN